MVQPNLRGLPNVLTEEFKTLVLGRVAKALDSRPIFLVIHEVIILSPSFAMLHEN